VGFILIGGAISILNFTLPKFGWKNEFALPDIFAVSNIQAFVLLGATICGLTSSLIVPKSGLFMVLIGYDFL